jgi:hypothetical protein
LETQRLTLHFLGGGFAAARLLLAGSVQLEDLLHTAGGKLRLLLQHAAVQGRQLLTEINGEIVKVDLVVKIIQGFPAKMK